MGSLETPTLEQDWRRLAFCREQIEDLFVNLAAGRVTGRSGRPFTDPATLSSVNTLAVLRGLADDLRPEATLEVGLALGASALALASSLAERGLPPARQHVAIDPFQRTAFDDVGRLSVERAGLAGFVEVIEEPSALVLPRLVAAGRRFGIVYVDGSHLYENVFVDCYHAVHLLAPGGVLVMDDAPHPHVARVVCFLRRSWRQCLEPLDLWPYRAAGAGARGRLRYRLAEALGKTQIVAFRRTAAVLRDERAAGGPV